MVGRTLSLPLVSIHVAVANGRAKCGIGDHEIDTHAPPPMEGAISVVPEGERCALESSRHTLRQPDAREIGQPPSLGLGDVGCVRECPDVPHIVIGRGDVEVTDDRKRLVGVAGDLGTDRLR